MKEGRGGRAWQSKFAGISGGGGWTPPCGTTPATPAPTTRISDRSALLPFSFSNFYFCLKVLREVYIGTLDIFFMFSYMLMERNTNSEF